VAYLGASAYAPENTIAAVNEAKTAKADIVDLDVRQTKDGKLVLLHDTTLARTTDVEQIFPGRSPWNVQDFTLDEIRRLDAGSWFYYTFRGERVPTLGEALAALQGSGVGVTLDVQSPSLYPGIRDNVAAELRAAPSWLTPDWREWLLTVQSADRDFVKSLHQLLPKVPPGLVGTPATAELHALAEFIDKINPPSSDVTAAYVHSVHESDMKAVTWTVDDTAGMQSMIDARVDGIMTARPDVLRTVIDGQPAPAV
jgi:glycerophosphoryl diester phosphodiesterase